MTLEPPSRDDLWEQYKIQVDLYKHYLTVVMQFNTLYYAVTGGILVYLLANESKVPFLRWGLLFPVVLSLAFGSFFLFAASKAKITAAHVVDLVAHLQVGTFPDLNMLTKVLQLFGGLQLVVALALGALLYLLQSGNAGL